jgi:hypothetical protein
MPERLDIADYLGLDLFDVGKMPNIGYGTVERVRAHCVAGGATALLTTAISDSDVTIVVSDASRFPATPFPIQIDTEIMTVTNKVGTSFTVTRGVSNTLAVAHRANRTIFEILTSYVYLLADHPVDTIDKVFIDGVRVLSGVTPYTGQAGDQLAGYGSKAVIEFTAEAVISRQFNLGTSEASANASGVSKAGIAAAWTDRSLADGLASTGITIGGTNRPYAFVGFSLDTGTIIRQTYTARIKGLDEVNLNKVKLVVQRNGSLIGYKDHKVEGGSVTTVSVTLDGGNFDDELVVVPQDGDTFEIYDIVKSVVVEASLEAETPASITPEIDITNLAEHPELDHTKVRSLFAEYSSSSFGTIEKQIHAVSVDISSEADIRISSADDTFTEYWGVTGSDTLIHEETGGNWADWTKITILTGALRVQDITKSVEYFSDEMLDNAVPVATASARIVVGADITADAGFYVDESGDYGGVGTLVTRPDYVIEHFLVEELGYTAGEIDTASFAAAGALYAAEISGGYKLAFVFTEQISPIEELMRMAFESRSTLKYDAGKWYLDFIPDVAPAADATIDQGKLAGQFSMFTFDKAPTWEIFNDFRARFKRVYTITDENQSDWAGVSTAADATSKSKYGTYKKDDEFRFIRSQAMADNVLAHYLTELKNPLMTIRFSVFFEYFNLSVGDTVQITNDLYNNEKFSIENAERDQETINITGRQWY